MHISKGVDGTPVSPVVDHLGLEMIAGILKANKHMVSQFDTMLMKKDETSLLSELEELSPELIGFTVNYANVQDTLNFIASLKELLPNTQLIAGGHYATFHLSSLLNNGFDLVVLGEGEIPMLQLADWGIEKKFQISGLAWLSGKTVFQNKPAIPPDLKFLPEADRELLPYITSFPRGCYKIAVEGSRGCLYNCRFCSIAATQSLSKNSNCRRMKNPVLLAEEIENLVKKFGIKDFWFMDPDFLGSSRNIPTIHKLGDEILRRGLDITLEIDTRSDAINEETIKILKASGLKTVFLGIESFDQLTLNSFSKGTVVQQNLNAIEILENHGIRPVLGTILFHPNSSIRQLKREHSFLRQIGYEKTQMLFRLKMYRGSRICAEEKDCGGRGVTQGEDYGWEINDPKLNLAWLMFDYCRTALLDIVFNDLTSLFRKGFLDTERFLLLTDESYHTLGDCVDMILEAIPEQQENCPNTMELQNSLQEILLNTRMKIFKSL